MSAKEVARAALVTSEADAEVLRGIRVSPQIAVHKELTTNAFLEEAWLRGVVARASQREDLLSADPSAVEQRVALLYANDEDFRAKVDAITSRVGGRIERAEAILALLRERDAAQGALP